MFLGPIAYLGLLIWSAYWMVLLTIVRPAPRPWQGSAHYRRSCRIFGNAWPSFMQVVDNEIVRVSGSIMLHPVRVALRQIRMVVLDHLRILIWPKPDRCHHPTHGESRQDEESHLLTQRCANLSGERISN